MEFLGSVNALINPSILKNLIYEDPIQSNAGLDVYEKAQKNTTIINDVARGLATIILHLSSLILQSFLR